MGRRGPGCAERQRGLQERDRFTSAKLQQVVTDRRRREALLVQARGRRGRLGIGDIEEPDATITQDYDTAVALSKNELTGTAAYMSGKLRVSGDLMKLMQLQGALAQMPAALATLDVEY